MSYNVLVAKVWIGVLVLGMAILGSVSITTFFISGISSTLGITGLIFLSGIISWMALWGVWFHGEVLDHSRRGS